MSKTAPARHTNQWYAAAAVPGLLHALASFYWALGGTWLLSTVGTDAVALGRDHPWLSAALLLPVAAIKGGLALAPLHWQPPPWWLRAVLWVSGAVLLGYGTLYTTVSALALGGAFGELPGADRTGLWGHALLWDPLFALWGLLLLVALWRDRGRRRREARTSIAPHP